MKTTILRTALKEGVAVVERATSRSSNLPILQNILLTVKGNTMEFAATDLETGIRYWSLTNNKKEGQVVVPSKVLSQLVNSLPDDSIDLQTTSSQLLLKTKTYTTTIKTMDPDEFPVIPSLSGDEDRVEFNAKELCSALSQVVPATGQSQMRPEISGVYISFQKDGIRLAATDSFRLAEKTVQAKSAFPEQWSFILPQKAVREIISIFGEKEGNVSLYGSSTQVIFEHANEEELSQPRIQLVSRLIDGEYPAYQEVIPKSFKVKATLNRTELMNHIKAASIFANKGSEVKLTTDPENKLIEISSQNNDVGENASYISADMSGDEAVSASFNWKFLSDGLSLIKSDSIQIGLNGEDGAAALIPGGNEGYIYIVMPIKS